jgi:transcriptional regulator with XRE-family HTH domain
MKYTFGNKIRELRKEKHLTLKQLSKKSGIEITYLSKIENNKTGSPEINTIEKLATALNVGQDTKEELYRLAKQIPSDIKNNITKSKVFFDVFRSAKDFNEEELLRIVDEIKKRKKLKDDKNNQE